MTQALLFDEADLVPWKREWQNMPEYSVEDLAPKHQLIVNFLCAADVCDFAAILGQSINPTMSGRQMPSVWFPEQEIGRLANKRYIDLGR